MASTIKSLMGDDSSREPSVGDVQTLRTKFEAVGQGHLFTFWDELSSAEKVTFFEQLSKFDPERIAVCTRPWFVLFFYSLFFISYFFLNRAYVCKVPLSINLTLV